MDAGGDAAWSSMVSSKGATRLCDRSQRAPTTVQIQWRRTILPPCTSAVLRGTSSGGVSCRRGRGEVRRFSSQGAHRIGQIQAAAAADRYSEPPGAKRVSSRLGDISMKGLRRREFVP